MNNKKKDKEEVVSRKERDSELLKNKDNRFYQLDKYFIVKIFKGGFHNASLSLVLIPFSASWQYLSSNKIHK